MLKGKKGFTLLEVLLSLVILSGGIVMLITMFTVGLKGVTVNQVRTQATNLAQDLMDEILGKDFDEDMSVGQPMAPDALGRDSGEDTSNRTAWDDVDDYLYLSTENSPPKNAQGADTAYAGFTRGASVWYVDAEDLAYCTYSTFLKKVSIWVSHPEISDAVLTGLKTYSTY
ncbi:prepilin-type N-terminal cleavage/methylation domain-containing protein [bacterium]|nr:prepilin-type N-terminal cleavage/methylation domain-containing protein [bacterium]